MPTFCDSPTNSAPLAEQAAEDSFRRLAGSPPPAHWPRPGQLPPPVPPQLDVPQRALDWALAQLESTRRSPRDNPELGVRLRRERDATGAEFADSLALRLSITECRMNFADLVQAEQPAP